MDNANNTSLKSSDNNNAAKNENSKDGKVPIHNPFEKGAEKQITQEDIENEQKFKEAMSERD